MEVAHVKVRRTKKEKENMTKIVRLVTERHEKADELARAGAMLDEGLMAEVRAVTFKQERERGGLRSLAMCSQFPLFSGGMERL